MTNPELNASPRSIDDAAPLTAPLAASAKEAEDLDRDEERWADQPCTD